MDINIESGKKVTEFDRMFEQLEQDDIGKIAKLTILGLDINTEYFIK